MHQSGDRNGVYFKNFIRCAWVIIIQDKDEGTVKQVPSNRIPANLHINSHKYRLENHVLFLMAFRICFYLYLVPFCPIQQSITQFHAVRLIENRIELTIFHIGS